MLTRHALLIILLSTMVLAARAGSASAGWVIPSQPVFFILAETDRHYPKLCAALAVVGFRATAGNYAAYLHARRHEQFILVVPAAESAQLNGEQCAQLQDDIRQGQAASSKGFPLFPRVWGWQAAARCVR